MTEPTEPIAVKIATCKECQKPFETEMRYKVRGEHKIAFQVTYWCSPLCKSQYRYRVMKA